MENRIGNNANETQQHYTYINGQKYFFQSEEERKAYNKMINDVRNRARKLGECGQTDYTKCSGDCLTCPWRRTGKTLSTDHENYVEGSTRKSDDKHRHAQPVQANRSAEDEATDKMTVAKIYLVADRITKNGAAILKLRFSHPGKPMSTYDIAEELGMKQTTVNDALNKVLSYIRTHRDEFI